MNNPFNIKVGSDTQQYIDDGQASVGRAAPDGGNFLTFKDRSTAVTAAQSLLFSSGVYKGLTVDQALKKWSNNGYGGNIVPSLSNSSIDSLTPAQQEQVLNAMEMKGENDSVPSGTTRFSDFKAGQLTLVSAGGAKKSSTPTKTGANPFGLPTPTLKQAATSVLNVAAPGVQGFGQEMAAALPSSVNGVDMARNAQQQNNQSDTSFIQAMNKKKAAGQPLTAQQQQVLATTEKNAGTPQPDAGAQVNPAINDTPGKVLENAGETALDVASVGTYGAAARGMESGVLATKANPTVVAPVIKAADSLVESGIAKTAMKDLSKVVDMVKPVANKRVSISAIRDGLGKAASFFKPASLDADKAAVQAGKAAQKVGVKAGMSFIDAANTVIKGIGDEANALKSKLASSKVTFTPQELNKALKSVKLPGLLRNNSTLDKTFGEIVDHVIGMSKTMPGKIGSVLDLRQEFDSEVERQFGDIYASERDMTPVRQAVKATRDALNDFIEQRVPQLEYKNSLHFQSSLYDALDNLAEKGAKELGKVTPKAQAIKNTAKWIGKAGAAFALGDAAVQGVEKGFNAVMGGGTPAGE